MSPGFNDSSPNIMMTSAKDLVLWPAQACLLSELVDHLQTDLHSTAVVFPTKRLGIYFLAKLAERYTALKAPKVFTLESLILDQLSLYEHSPVIISEMGQKILLSTLIKESSFKHIRIGHEHEIMQIFSEIAEMELDEQVFQKLLDYLSTDIYRGDEEIRTLCERAEEFKTLFSTFHNRLAQTGLRPLYQALSHGAKVLSKVWAKDRLEYEGVTFPWSHLYVVGFTSVTKGEQYLLKALGERDDVSIWLSEPDQTQNKLNPLADLVNFLSQTPKKPIKKNEKKTDSQTIHIFKSPSIFTELKVALSIVDQLVEKGMPPSHIGLLVTSESTYGRLIHSTLLEEHIEANAAITCSLSQTPIGCWIKSLATLATKGEETENLHQFMMQPFTLTYIKHAVQTNMSEQEIAYKISDVLTSGKMLGQPPSKFKGLEDLAEKLKFLNEERLEQAIRKMSALIAPLRIADHSREKNKDLSGWTDCFGEVLSQFVSYSKETKDQFGEYSRSAIETAKEVFLSVMHELSYISDHVSDGAAKTFKAHDFWSIIENHLLTQDIRTAGELFRGMQIITLREARYVPFEVVIVLGCTEGNFPKRLPPDDLINYHMKSRMGLHVPGHLEALEDVTFGLLKARIPHMFLLFSTEEMGEPTSPSRFIERLVCEEKIPIQDASLLQLSKSPLAISEHTSSQYEEGLFKGDIKLLLHKLSATQIEKLIRCPYSFLLSKLGIKETSLQVVDDVLREGRYLHGVLEAFYTGSFNSRKICESLAEINLSQINTGNIENSFKDICLARLLLITEAIFPKDLQETPLYNHLIAHSWPRFAEHVSKLVDRPITELSLKTLGSGYKELKIDGDDVLVMNYCSKKQDTCHKEGVSDFHISVSGVVDSVDFFNEGSKKFQVITDYKRSLAPSSKQVAIGLSPQLPFYAFILSRQELANSKAFPVSQTIIGYWNIIEGTWQPRNGGKDVKEAAISRGLLSSNTRAKPLEEVISNFESLLSWRIEEVLKGKFSIDISLCEMCAYSGICRKDDPLYKDHFKNKIALKTFTNEGGSDE